MVATVQKNLLSRTYQLSGIGMAPMPSPWRRSGDDDDDDNDKENNNDDHLLIYITFPS